MAFVEGQSIMSPVCKQFSGVCENKLSHKIWVTTGHLYIIIEPPRGKTNNVVSEQV